MSLLLDNSGHFTGEPPYAIPLGETHKIEVKKGGLYIGVYLITPTLARRGLILPRTVWNILLQKTLIINSGIARAREIVLEKCNSKNGKQHGRRQLLCNESEYVPSALQSYFHYFPNEGPIYEQEAIPFNSSNEQFEQYDFISQSTEGFNTINSTGAGGECQPEDLSTTQAGESAATIDLRQCGKQGPEAEWGDNWLSYTT